MFNMCRIRSQEKQQSNEYRRSSNCFQSPNNDACNYCRSSKIYTYNPTKNPSRTTKKKTWQRYGESKQICDNELDSNAADWLQSDLFTPTSNACRPDVNMTPPKGKDGGWLLISIVNKNYVPIVDLNSEEFKQKETPIKFRICFKKRVLLSMKKNQVLEWFWTCISRRILWKKFKIIWMIMWRRGGVL